MMTKLTLTALLDKAEERHGHRCPSLYYGVKTAVAALDLANQRNITVKQAVVQGTSKCIRDGATTVLENEVQLTPLAAPAGCGISLGNGKQNIQLEVKPQVREKINSLNKQLPLEEFQREGLKYLQCLSDEDLFEVRSLKPEHFTQLLKEGK
jgi:formylmethanofuran dehydrogenase subunit E